MFALGGLLVTFVLSIGGIVLSFPIGVALALGRIARRDEAATAGYSSSAELTPTGKQPQTRASKSVLSAGAAASPSRSK